MKKITIGRGRECDIIIDDSTDTVSRRQAVITFSPFGKMMIYDTSSNGTFVNGIKVEKPDGMPLKRGDNVNLAHIADLDWEKVKNPYRKIMLSLLVMFFSAVAVAILFIVFADRITSVANKDTDRQETADQINTSVINPEDSLTLKVPVETPTSGPVRTPAVKKNNVVDNPKSKPDNSTIGSSPKKESEEISDTKDHHSTQKLEDALDQR